MKFELEVCLKREIKINLRVRLGDSLGWNPVWLTCNKNVVVVCETENNAPLKLSLLVPMINSKML